MLIETVSSSNSNSSSLSTGNGSSPMNGEDGQGRCLLDQDTYHRMLQQQQSSAGSTFDVNSNGSDTDSSGEESTSSSSSSSSGGMHFFEGAEKRLVLYLSGGSEKGGKQGGVPSKRQHLNKMAVNGAAMSASEMALLSAGESVNLTQAQAQAKTLASSGQMVDKPTQYGPGPDLRTIPR